MTFGPLLLDDSRLEGVQSINRALGPPRLALAIDKGDLSDAANGISELCLAWGGAAGALIPAQQGTDELDPIWRDHLDSGMFDEFCTRELVRGNEDIMGTAVHDYVGGASVFSMAYGAGRKHEDWPTVRCDLPEPEDPWYVAYLGWLGSWPEEIPESNLRAAGLREGLIWGPPVVQSRSGVRTETRFKGRVRGRGTSDWRPDAPSHQPTPESVPRPVAPSSRR